MASDEDGTAILDCHRLASVGSPPIHQSGMRRNDSAALVQAASTFFSGDVRRPDASLYSASKRLQVRSAFLSRLALICNLYRESLSWQQTRVE